MQASRKTKYDRISNQYLRTSYSNYFKKTLKGRMKKAARRSNMCWDG